jgi:hypothetical protein
MSGAAASHAIGRLVTETAEAQLLPRYWNSRSLAARLAVSVSWVETWYSRGLLKGTMLHAVPGDRGKLLFAERDVIEFLRARGMDIPEVLEP